MEAQGLIDKVHFTDPGTIKYRVETILTSGRKSGWKQHFDTFEDAQEFIERERKWFDGVKDAPKYLVTEVGTRTIGLF